jgi:hypothetical protein
VTWLVRRRGAPRTSPIAVASARICSSRPGHLRAIASSASESMLGVKLRQMPF